MGTLHDLLATRGKQAALELGMDRRLVEVASDYLSDEDAAVSFAFSGWAQVALPHRQLPNDQPWTLVTDRAALMIQPGLRMSESGKAESVGVPYGSRARMIMLYLQTEAIRTGSREVALGKSLRDWLSRMGISIGGKSVKDVKDQAERLSRCRLSLEVKQEGRRLLDNQQIVDRALFVDMDESPQGKLFLEAAQLSENFFAQLQRHPVPIEEAAIRAISNHSMSLDIYLWLAYRLHSLSNPRPITWASLKIQFGGGINQMFHFKARFLESLELATAVYPEAKVEITATGLTLRQSRPPVAPRLHQGHSPTLLGMPTIKRTQGR
jgi:hypothetical protein